MKLRLKKQRFPQFHYSNYCDAGGPWGAADTHRFSQRYTSSGKNLASKIVGRRDREFLLKIQ
jgi:hypothetical protein